MEKELVERAEILYHESKAVEERLHFIDEQLHELREFSTNLNKLKTSQERELLASLGKGVFVKSTIQDTRVFVDVGAGVIVRKNIDEVKDVITQQIARLNDARRQTASYFAELNRDLQMLLTQIS